MYNLLLIILKIYIACFINSIIIILQIRTRKTVKRKIYEIKNEFFIWPFWY
jgi:hypothetical protein